MSSNCHGVTCAYKIKSVYAQGKGGFSAPSLQGTLRSAALQIHPARSPLRQGPRQSSAPVPLGSVDVPRTDPKLDVAVRDRQQLTVLGLLILAVEEKIQRHLLGAIPAVQAGGREPDRV